MRRTGSSSTACESETAVETEYMGMRGVQGHTYICVITLDLKGKAIGSGGQFVWNSANRATQQLV